MNVGCRIFTEVKRPEKEMVMRWKDIPVANIDDNMNRLYAMDAGLVPVSKAPLCGTAITVKAPCGDNLMFHKAMDMAEEGDIIVVSGICAGDRSFCGEVMAHYARMKGIAGFVVDGYIRDWDSIAEMNFPVYARGTSPNGPLKEGPGEINVPIACGGQVVFPGDIIVGDQDGVVVIHPEDADFIYEKSAAQMENEAKKMAGLDQGINTLNREWIQKALDNRKCTIIRKDEMPV